VRAEMGWGAAQGGLSGGTRVPSRLCVISAGTAASQDRRQAASSRAVWAPRV